MALDNKELANANLEQASAESLANAERLKVTPDVLQTPERPQFETGNLSGDNQMAGGVEKGYVPASQQPTAYSPATDPAYQSYKQIESILEEELGEIYNNLTPKEQKEFKIKGEETTRSIFQLVYHQTKINVKKIIKLIRNWLKIIPGMNKFFLEQEAKIKADKIVALAKEDKKIQF